MRRPCITHGCPALVEDDLRCAECERDYQRERNARPERAVYRDPAYQAMVPYGLCYLCGERPATTRDHVIPLSKGGTNDPANIRFACHPCNSAKGDRAVSGSPLRPEGT